MKTGSEPNAVLAIPARLNVFLALLAMGGSSVCLWIASQTFPLAIRLAAGLAFSFVNNTVFSLLHEAVHGIFHPSLRVNAFFGRWLAAFFPTSFSLQRFFHLGHHRRNRTPAERFDYIAPGENPWLVRWQWYSILTGFYWFLPPLSSLTYGLMPRILQGKLFGDGRVAWRRQSAAMVDGLETVKTATARAEVIFVLLWQIGLGWVLGLSWSGWFLCYAAFAVNWSSLQYADHAWSPLDVKSGAWNLKVNPVVQGIFLNYHHHLAHHENTSVSWIHLGRFVDRNHQPRFLRIYWEMWKGPKPLPKDAL